VKKPCKWIESGVDGRSVWRLRLSSNKKPDRCQVVFCRNKPEPGRSKCYKCRREQTRKNNPVWATWYHKRRNAQLRGISFELTLHQYTELLASKPSEDHVLDRIDPLRGYSVGNLQWLTYTENNVKGATFDKEAWRQQRISNHQIEYPNQSYDPDTEDIDPDNCPF